MHFGWLDLQEVAPITHRNFFTSEMAASINRRVCLRDQVVLFPISSEIIDLVSHATVMNFAIRRLDETEFVDPRERAHRADQTDVWTFRRLNRTNPSVMRWMNVAHFEACAIAAQAARPESGQTAFVRQLRQRIRLIHELRTLGTSKAI